MKIISLLTSLILILPQASNSKENLIILARLTKPSESMQVGLPNKRVFSGINRSSYYQEDLIEDEDDYETAEYQTTDEEFAAAKDEVVPEGRYRGYFKVGKPYQISGEAYYPQNYDNFEQVGVASWYGPNFHGKETANGEIYDSNDMTAAHRTLPLPSIARVTNLNNGKSVIVRINDRGPFAKDRVIDLSEKVAETLEFKDKCTADVKVELLREETDKLIETLKLRN